MPTAIAMHSGGDIHGLSSPCRIGQKERRIIETVPDALLLEQSGRSPKVVALFSATNFSSYIIELLQLHVTIQIK